jgi:hypothetical protein
MGRLEKSCQNQIEADVDLIERIDIAKANRSQYLNASAIISIS